MRDYRRFWVLWSPLAYMAGIFLLSSVPGEIHPEEPGMLRVFLWVPPDVQNLLHVPVYAGLAWLWCGSLQRLRLPQGTVIWLAFALTVGYGLLDELHQSFVPGRLANGADLLLNTLGAALAVWLFRRWPGRVLR